MTQKNMIDPEEISEETLDDVSAGEDRRPILDHIGAYNFKVEIEGIAVEHTKATSQSYFKGVDGLSAELKEPIKKG